MLLLKRKFRAAGVECVYWKLPGGRYRLYWSDAGTFDVNPRTRQIRARLAVDAPPAAVEEVLRGPALSFALLAGGFEPLHASAVQFQGRCIAFAGASGAGKSSLCAYLCRKGARFFSDDVLPLKLGARGVRAFPGLRQHRLTRKSLRALGTKLRPPHLGKATLVASHVGEQPLSLSAIYVLERAKSPAARVHLRRHAAAEAFALLVSLTANQTYAAPARMENQLRVFAWVARSVPVWTLRYPSRFSAWREIEALLERERAAKTKAPL